MEIGKEDYNFKHMVVLSYTSIEMQPLIKDFKEALKLTVSTSWGRGSQAEKIPYAQALWQEYTCQITGRIKSPEWWKKNEKSRVVKMR